MPRRDGEIPNSKTQRLQYRGSLQAVPRHEVQIQKSPWGSEGSLSISSLFFSFEFELVVFHIFCLPNSIADNVDFKCGGVVNNVCLSVCLFVGLL